jgi:hypothetical protein
MGKKLTQEEAEAKSLAVGISMTGQYTLSCVKTNFRCPFCNTIFSTLPCRIWSKGATSCGCVRVDKLLKRNNSKEFRQIVSENRWRGTKDISGHYFACIKNGAKKRNITICITIEFLQELLEKQQYKCVVSGLPISMSRSCKKKHSTYSEQTASLDRIDSSKGYLSNNVQWVHKDINRMKQNFSEARFLELCKLVAKNNY